MVKFKISFHSLSTMVNLLNLRQIKTINHRSGELPEYYEVNLSRASRFHLANESKFINSPDQKLQYSELRGPYPTRQDEWSDPSLGVFRLPILLVVPKHIVRGDAELQHISLIRFYTNEDEDTMRLARESDRCKQYGDVISNAAIAIKDDIKNLDSSFKEDGSGIVAVIDGCVVAMDTCNRSNYLPIDFSILGLGDAPLTLFEKLRVEELSGRFSECGRGLILNCYERKGLSYDFEPSRDVNLGKIDLQEPFYMDKNVVF